MAQRIMALAGKPDNPSVISRYDPSMITQKNERIDSHKLSSDNVPTHINTQTHFKKN